MYIRSTSWSAHVAKDKSGSAEVYHESRSAAINCLADQTLAWLAGPRSQNLWQRYRV